MNLDKIYTVKSNATRDLKKAIAKGELADTAEVVVVPSGYQIVLPYVAPEAVDPNPISIDVFAEAAELAKATRTPQVPALAGMTPLGLPPGEGVRGFDPAKADALRNSNADVDKVPAYTERKAPAAPADKMDYGMALAVALANAKVWTERGLPLSTRAGVWVPFDSVHDSLLPHGLSKGQMPASTGNARKRGLIEIAGSWEVNVAGPRKLMIRLTPAGLTAGRAARKESV